MVAARRASLYAFRATPLKPLKSRPLALSWIQRVTAVSDARRVVLEAAIFRGIVRSCMTMPSADGVGTAGVVAYSPHRDRSWFLWRLPRAPPGQCESWLGQRVRVFSD